MQSRDLIKKLEKLAPPEYAESWDNPGLLVGSADREVHKVYIALDADGGAVEKAVQCGCDMILTHHPLLFSAIKSIRDEDFIGADRLGLKNRMPLAMVRETESGLKGIGASGTLDDELTLAELAALVRKAFDLPQVRCYGDPETIVRKISMCPGSGKGMDADVLKAGSQVFITGVVDHHYGVEKEICVIDAGHHGLEHIFVPYMEQWLKENCPEIQTVTDDNQSPFFVI